MLSRAAETGIERPGCTELVNACGGISREATIESGSGSGHEPDGKVRVAIRDQGVADGARKHAYLGTRGVKENAA